MWKLDYKESWVLKNWCFGTVVLQKTFENPLDCKEIKPPNLNGNQSWMFIGKSDAVTEIQYFGHLIWRTDSLEKTLMLGMIDCGKRRELQRMRLLDGINDFMDMSLSKLWELVMNKGSLVCCSPWGREELDTTACLNWTELLKECTFNMSQFPCIWHVLTGSSL